jgi:hypothetical protein
MVADATNLPLRDRSVGCLVSVLGDSYNTLEFWREVERVMLPTGTVVFTTPSYEWSSRFRAKADDAQSAAEFVLSDGTGVAVPSFIRPVHEQIQLLKEAGLALQTKVEVPLEDVNHEPLSRKLADFVGALDPIVVGYLATKE